MRLQPLNVMRKMNYLKTSKHTKGKKKAKTAEQDRWMDRVATLGCLICDNPHVILHHITTLQLGYGRKSSHFATLPLCFGHHDAKIEGESIHQDIEGWEKKYGTQIYWLKEVYERLGESLERCEKVINKEIY